MIAAGLLVAARDTPLQLPGKGVPACPMSNIIPDVKPAGRTRPAPLPPPKWSYHQVRKLIHLVCFLVFLGLPFLNVMRFDLPRQRFYFAGYELGISEFSILFFTLLFLMFVIVAVALIYGRIYCGCLCRRPFSARRRSGGRGAWRGL